MVGFRLSRLQKRALRWLLADERRRGTVIYASHQELVVALPHAKGNISHSLRRLEAQGLIILGRGWEGGYADYLRLTPEGRQRAYEIE